MTQLKSAITNNHSTIDLGDGYFLTINKCVQNNKKAIGISIRLRENKTGYSEDIAGTSMPLKEFVEYMRRLL